jgi:hypothetical protein
MTPAGGGGGDLDGLVDEFERQSAAFFLAARDRPWASVHVEPDLIWGTTGIPLANFNGATNARFADASVDDRIETT